MSELQHADEVFVRDLEWQLKTELRRKRRFEPVKNRSRLPGVVQTMGLIVLCAATGFAAAVTIEHFENARMKELQTVRAETAVEVLQGQQGMIREVVNNLEARVEAGLANETQLAEVRLQSDLNGYELDRARLDVEEVQLTGRTPNHELYAPMVGRRDFVTERLQIEQLAAFARTRFIEAELSHLQQLAQEGLVNASQEHEIEMQHDRLGAEMQDILRRIEIRRAFLKGDVTAREVNLEERLLGARARLEVAENIVSAVANDHEGMMAMRAEGTVSAIQLKEVEFQLSQSRAEERLARMELEYLEETLSH